MKIKPAVLGIIMALSGAEIQAGTMGVVGGQFTPKVYLSVFGGGGSSNRLDINQSGTAFFTEAEGGPLAVNAFGRSSSRSVGIIGGNVGYQWGNIDLHFLSAQGVSPAIELEGYYLGKSSFTGHELNNETTRLPEHDFLVTYPTNAGVFLVNAVLNLNLASHSQWHPYVGAGIGGAVLSISNADALQVSPPEAGVNHYNSNPSDKATTFAAQGKVGLSFDITSNLSTFVEYRGLYLANSSFTFGSTVYPTHAATSSWNVKLSSQFYNMGSVGVRLAA